MACFFLLKKHCRIGGIGFLLVFNYILYTVFSGTVVISNKIKKMKMNRVNRNYWLAAVLMIALGVMPAGVSAQSKRDVEQTYVLNQPYETGELEAPNGK